MVTEKLMFIAAKISDCLHQTRGTQLMQLNIFRNLVHINIYIMVNRNKYVMLFSGNTSTWFSELDPNNRNKHNFFKDAIT